MDASTASRPANNSKPGIPNPEPLDSNSDLHEKFRTLIALLRILLAINGDTGYPMFHDTKAQKIEDLSSRHRLINVLTTILVLDREILAVVPLKPSGHLREATFVVFSEDPLNPIDDCSTLDTLNRVEIEDDGIPSDANQSPIIGAHRRDDHEKVVSYSGDSVGGFFLISGGHDFWPQVRAGDLIEVVNTLK